MAPDFDTSDAWVGEIPWLADAPALTMGERSAIRDLVTRARKKFRQFDVDGNNKINGEEIGLLADWVWGSFHPDGEPITPSARKGEMEKLAKRADLDADGMLSFEEFAQYFTRTSEAVARFRKKYATTKRNGTPMQKYDVVLEEQKMLAAIPIAAPQLSPFEADMLHLEFVDIMKASPAPGATPCCTRQLYPQPLWLPPL